MKRVLIVTEDQYHLIINALNDLRTKCIEKILIQQILTNYYYI